MLGFVVIACWIMLAVVFILFGKLSDNRILLGIGAVMVLMVSMVGDVSY